MSWPLLIAYILLAVGLGYCVSIWPTLQRLKKRNKGLEADLAKLKFQLARLKELNEHCLDHASRVLTEWVDYRSAHDKKED